MTSWAWEGWGGKGDNGWGVDMIGRCRGSWVGRGHDGELLQGEMVERGSYGEAQETR